MPKSGRRVRIFSALEVANICGVVNQTAINWIRNGHLKAFTTPGGQYRIYAKDLAAFLDKRGMSASGEVLQVMMENADWNTFLVALEPSLFDSIKDALVNLFPEYVIIQASDWFEIGRKLTEEKPGFVLLDTELPGADISKFITTVKDDSFFGKPNVIFLTDGSLNIQNGRRSNADESKHSHSDSYADAVLKKPLDLDQLKATMRDLEKQLDMVITA